MLSFKLLKISISKIQERREIPNHFIAVIAFSFGPCTFKMCECIAVQVSCVFKDAIIIRCGSSTGLLYKVQAFDSHQTAYGCGSRKKSLNTLTHRYKLKIMLLSLLWTCFLIFFFLNCILGSASKHRCPQKSLPWNLSDQVCQRDPSATWSIRGHGREVRECLVLNEVSF